MYLGRIVEVGGKKDVFENPLHPYTFALLASVPVLGSRNLKSNELAGDVPTTPTQLSQGCLLCAVLKHKPSAKT